MTTINIKQKRYLKNKKKSAKKAQKKQSSMKKQPIHHSKSRFC